MRQASTLDALGRTAEAIPLLATALEQAPSNEAWRRQLSKTVRKRVKQLADTEPAADHEAYRALIDFDPQSHAAREAYARTLIDAGDLATAQAMLRHAIDAFPTSPVYAELLLKTLAKRDAVWQRLEVLQLGLPSHRSDPSWLRDLSATAVIMGDHATAVDALRALDELSEAKPEDLYHYARSLAEIGSDPFAKEIMTRADTLAASGKDRDLALLGFGVVHQRMGEWDEAARAYALHLMTHPDSAELAYRAGLALDRCYRWSEAEPYYRYALSLEPHNHYWSYKLGLSLERQELWHDAARAYIDAASNPANKNPGYPRYRATRCLHKAGDDTEACKIFFGSLATPDQSTLLGDGLGPRFVEPTHLDEQPRRYATYWLRRAAIARVASDPVAESLALAGAIDRTSSHPTELMERRAAVEHARGNAAAAADLVVRSRIFQEPDGVNVDRYTKTDPLAYSARYLAYAVDWPLRERTVLFESNHGSSAGCHPLAIFTAMVRDSRFDDWTFVWAAKPGVALPQIVLDHPRVVVAELYSDLYLRYLATAEYLVNNVSFPTYFIRRDGQKYLNTWHGTPLKTLGRDMRMGFLQHTNIARNFLQASHLISPNAHTTWALVDRHDIAPLLTARVAELGSPRSDVGVAMSSADRDALREKLGVPEGVPVVLYAPTWRGSVTDPEADVELTNHALAQLDSLRHGHVLFRGHRLAEQQLRASGLADRLVPVDIDTNELLALVDVLVTDYSSIFFDFLPYERPVVFLVPDEAEYREQRGLYFQIDDLPGPTCREVAQLAATVESVLHPGAPVSETQQAWTRRFAPHEDGRASKRAVDFLVEDNATHAVERAHPSARILVHSALIPNGITSSLHNLLNSINPDGPSITVLAEPKVVESNPDRHEQFLLLPPHVGLIGRDGVEAQTVEERWVASRVYDRHRFLSEEHHAINDRVWRREFRRVFGTVSFDAVIEFDGYSPSWTGLLSAANDSARKLVFQHNNMYEEWTTKFPSLNAVFQQYRKYDKVVAVSPSVRDSNRAHLAEAFGVPYEKFAAAHNQMNPQSVRSRADVDLDPDMETWFSTVPGHTFVSIGRLSPEKGPELLLESFADVADRFSCKLVLVGSGFLRPSLEAICARLGLGDRVFFAGQRPNPMSILNAADTFVMTSRHEGQPMVLGEAMTLGKPIICTELDGTRDLLENRYGALVPRSREAFVAAMVSAVEGLLSVKPFDAGAYVRQSLREYSELCGVDLPVTSGFDT